MRWLRGCGCDARARWFEDRYGVPTPLSHLVVMLALATAGIIGASWLWEVVSR